MPFLLFVIWIVLEVMLSLRLAEWFGAGPVMLGFLASIALGVIVIRRAGWTAVQRIQRSVEQREVPARDMLNALMLFMAGALLIVPGPISDVIGLFLLLPIARAPALRAVDAKVRQARPDLHEPVTIEGEFEEVKEDPDPERPPTLPRRDD